MIASRRYFSSVFRPCVSEQRCGRARQARSRSTWRPLEPHTGSLALGVGYANSILLQIGRFNGWRRLAFFLDPPRHALTLDGYMVSADARPGVRSTFGPVSLAYGPELKEGFAS